jgi:FkbM family methyltransferase
MKNPIHIATRHAALNLGSVSDALYRKALRFVRNYRNFDYDPATNGEQRLLRVLAPLRIDTVFDVGANDGSWALACAQILGQASRDAFSIHAFEVVPETAEKMIARVSGVPAITANRFGLSNAEGPIEIFVDPSQSWLSSTVPGGSAIHGDRFKTVRGTVTTGDRYSAAHAIGRIGFLKIDVEGGEGLVLQGFQELLAGQRIDVIQFEYGLQNIFARFLLLDFYRLLESHGYALGKLYPDGVCFKSWVPEDEDFLGPNFVAVLAKRADIRNAVAARHQRQ